MTVRRYMCWAWWVLALVGYLALAGWNLGLPGLHYDEAREAGVNAMELLTGAPVTAFRDAALQVGGLHLPLMVQDYIGALNVYLSLPFLWLSGIGVPNLRLLSVLIGLLTLIVLERCVSEWLATRCERTAGTSPLTIGGLGAMTLAAFSPAFVFWSRQGIFVTNLMTLCVLLCLCLGVRWLRTGQGSALILCALAGGVALYAKLLAIWVLLPFSLLLLFGYWRLWRAGKRSTPRAATVIWALGVFLAALLPLILFNLQTGGTWIALAGNLGRSYYGVENSDLVQNLAVRAPQIWQVLEGSFLWYLGGIQANPLAPWLAALSILAGALVAWRRVIPPLLLAGGAFLLSGATISDLFITHYAVVQVVLLGIVGTALGVLVETDDSRRLCAPEPNAPRQNMHGRAERAHRRLSAGGVFVVVVVVLWAVLDLQATVGYHRLLADSGGLADHSDASYQLAYHLRHNGMGAPIALDWGMDGPVRYLTEGAVTPIEIFGYDSPEAPDGGFAMRLEQFIGNSDNVYLLHAPEAEVFRGRRSQFESIAAEHQMMPTLEAVFAQRDGTPLYEIWRLEQRTQDGR